MVGKVALNSFTNHGHFWPNPMRMRSALIPGLFAFIVFALPNDTLGASNDDARASTPQPSQAPLLWLEVVADKAPLDLMALRRVVEEELGIRTIDKPTEGMIGHVKVQAPGNTWAILQYESADGATRIERRVALPLDSVRRLKVLAWVTANLVRNEAVEILAELDAKKRAAQLEGDPTASSSGAESASESSVSPAESEPRSSNLSPSNGEVVLRNVAFYVRSRAEHVPDLGPTEIGHLAFFSPISQLPWDARYHRFYSSLSLLYGHVGSVTGLGVGAFIDRIDAPSFGAQISGFGILGSEYRGIMIAGAGSYAARDLHGAEIAGLMTARKGCVVGAQISGFGAIASRTCGTAGGASSDSVEGAQLAGGFAYSGGRVRGAQTAFVANIAGGDVNGLQLSSLFNLAFANVQGAQITSGLNLAEDLHGLQLGFVNVAKKTLGLQLGFVNVAKDNRGLSLGLFNWTKGARLSPTYFFQSPGYHNAGYRNTSGYSTASLSFGYDGHRDRARTHFAMGLRAAVGPVSFNCETGYGWVLENLKNRATDRAHELDLIGTVSLEVMKDVLSLYGGGGVIQPVAGVVAREPRALGLLGITLF